MYTVAGATGQVGSAVAHALLEAGEDVNVLVRDADKGAHWSERGAKVTIADLHDAPRLADALRASQGAFVLLPFNLAVPDTAADQYAMAAAITEAVRDSGVPHVAMLSSLGADLADGPELLRWLGELESGLRATGTVVTAVRSAHFQEKVRELFGPVQAADTYPVFGDSADVPTAMVASRDVGAVIAKALASLPAAHQYIDVEGPEYTERQAAEALGALIGRSLQVVTIPRAGWTGALTEAGVPEQAAELLAGLYEAVERGLVTPRAERHVRGQTPIEGTLRGLASELTTL